MQEIKARTCTKYFFAYCEWKAKSRIVRFKLQKQPPELFYKKRCSKYCLQYSTENNCVRVLFNKSAGYRPATSLKKRLRNNCFPTNTLFYRTPPLAASGYSSKVKPNDSHKKTFTRKKLHAFFYKERFFSAQCCLTFS